MTTPYDGEQLESEPDQFEEYEEELTEEQKGQLIEGVKKVEEILGDIDGISKEVIEDTLWYYYFDVDQTVNYLREKYKRDSDTSTSRSQDGLNSASASSIKLGLNSLSKVHSPTLTKETLSSKDTPLVDTQTNSLIKPNALSKQSIGKSTESSSKLTLGDITSRLSLASNSISSTTNKSISTSILGSGKPLAPLSSSTLSKSSLNQDRYSAKSNSTFNISNQIGINPNVKALSPLPSSLSKNKVNGLTGLQSLQRPLSTGSKHNGPISLSDLSGKISRDGNKDHTHTNIITSALSALSNLSLSNEESSKKSQLKSNLSKAEPVKLQSSSRLSLLSPLVKSEQASKTEKKPSNIPHINNRDLPSTYMLPNPPDQPSPAPVTPLDTPLQNSNLIAPPSVFAISVFERLDQDLAELQPNEKDHKFFYSMQSELLPRSVTPFKFNSPSPDDTILAAQAHRSGGKLEAR
ncbi:hypothetical protein K7432_000797 [Basidiobolus ranarum]|uniref:HBS1-like protein N-terminal domain-containing protein n=1 Tax=Basidiobolus ranarum TaxID=34480 RepID=A0ABR2X419_9FUNG